MTHMITRAAAIAIAALALTTSAQAQGRTKGFMLGVHTTATPGITISSDEMDGDFSTELGAGGGVTVGWGFTPIFSVFASATVAKQKTAPEVMPTGSFGLTHVQFGARANLPLGKSTIPYITASYGRRALAARAMFDDGESDDVAITGTMVGAGAGIEHSISATMAIDAGVDVSTGKLGHFKAGDNEWDSDVARTTSYVARLGVTWRPGARR